MTRNNRGGGVGYTQQDKATTNSTASGQLYAALEASSQSYTVAVVCIVYMGRLLNILCVRICPIKAC